MLPMEVRAAARLRDEQTGEVVAAVGPPKDDRKRSNLMNSMLGENSKRELIRKYDEDGPGVVGFYLDLKADMAALCEYRVQRWDRQTRTWVWDETPVVQGVLNDLRSPDGDTIQDFVRSMARETEAVGEVVMVEVAGSGDVSTLYRTAPVDSFSVISRDQNANPVMLGFKGSPSAKKGLPGERVTDYFEAPYGNTQRIWRPHPRWFDLAYSPLMRSLTDLRRFDNAGRAIHRTIASQLVMSGLLHFTGDERDLASYLANRRGGQTANRTERLGYLAQTITDIMEFSERHLADIDDKLVSAAMPYPIVSPTPPSWVDLGRDVDSGLLDVKEDALRDFARDVNIPASVLVEGQGAAQRMLNEYLQDRALKQTAVIPDARRIAKGLTVAFLHPRLRAIQSTPRGAQILSSGGNPQPVTDYRIWPDDAPLSNDDIDPKDVLEGVKAGELRQGSFANALGRPDLALELPGDVTPYEHFQELNGIEAEAQPEPTEVTASVWWNPPR